MKFLVTRESNCGSHCHPRVDGAVYEKFTRVEIRTFPTFAEFDEKFGKREGAWTSKGTNHREMREQGHIARDIPGGADGWFIEVDTIDQLIAIADQEGGLEIGWSMLNGDIREIEI